MPAGCRPRAARLPRRARCTSSPARAAPASPPSPPRSPWPSPRTARTCCSARSRAARASPSCSTSTRSPTRSAGSPRACRTDGARRRRLRAAHRPRVGAAGVPRDVLPARPRRPGARPVRRHRVRHHDRARRARRAADRQGLRGGQAQPRATRARIGSTTRSCSTPRRPGGSPSSSTSTASSPGWPRSGPIKTPGRQRDDAAPLAAHRGPPGHRARGDAGAGDRRRHRRAARGTACRRRRGGQPGPAPGPRRRGRWRPLRERQASTRARSPPTWSKAGLDADDALVDGLLGEARDHAERRAPRGRPARARRRPRTCPTYELPRLPGGIDLGGALRAGRGARATRGLA